LVADIEAGTRLRMFENRVLRKICGPRRNEVTGEWRKLHNEELNDQYCSGDKIEKNKMGGTYSTYGEDFNNLFRKSCRL